MDNHSEKFVEKIAEIKDLYAEVKEVIILAENFDPSSDVYLSPLTELRNTLDHIMRSFIYPNKLEAEFDEAKEHLYRAGYDAYEVLSINISNAIVKRIEKYSTRVITTVFPAYYTDVKQSIISIQVDLAEIRAHKRLNPETGTKSFTPYKEKVSQLLIHHKACEFRIPDLQKERRNGWIKAGVGFLIGVVITILGLYLYDRYFKVKTSSEVTSVEVQKKLTTSKIT
jgi:hypothetical protein